MPGLLLHVIVSGIECTEKFHDGNDRRRFVYRSDQLLLETGGEVGPRSPGCIL
jgi:hypothetical protein